MYCHEMKLMSILYALHPVRHSWSRYAWAVADSDRMVLKEKCDIECKHKFVGENEILIKK